MTRLAPLALVVALGSGCAWATASPYEYATYRKVRVEPTFDARVAAASDYLDRYPDGAYASDVRRYFERAEPVYFARRGADIEGLRAYLRALPHGPHAAEARSRLLALQALRDRPDSLSVAATATEARLAEAAASRDRARAELSSWIEMLVDPAAYEAPLAEGPRELVIAFSLSLPMPMCRPADGERRVCEKEIAVPYGLPTPLGVETRELRFVVTLEEDAAGRPAVWRMDGEELFSRLAETSALKPVRFDDVEERAVAIEAALDAVYGAFSVLVSDDPACRHDAASPEVMRLACRGHEVVVRAATEAGGLDSIAIERAAGEK